MTKYIDANYLFKCQTCRHFDGDECDTFCDSYECYSPDMLKIPTADVVELNEKLIPKKLKVEVVTGRNVRSLYYYCPSCNGFRMETTKHCSNCGQALDWKETFLEYGLEKAYKNWEKLVEESEVVKVVRCKDCIYKTVTEDGEYNPDDIVCGYHMSDGFSADDFCSYGKRKDDT